MRLTWHIVWKDLTRLRLPLALWALTFIWEFAIGVRLLRGEATDIYLFERLKLYDFLAYGLQVVIGYVLVAALVHEDPLVGSTAFWPTRPISGLRLLGAKLLGCLVIFGVLPALATLPWWLYSGYGAHEILWGALDSFYLRVPPTVAGFAVAALTSTMSRFLAGTVLIVALVVIPFETFMRTAPSLTGSADIALLYEMSDARIWILIFIGLVGFSFVAAHQFLTRSLNRSITMLGCVLTLLVIEAVTRPLDLTHFIEHASWPARALPTADNVQIEFKEARAQPNYTAQNEETLDSLRETFIAVNLPPEHDLTFGRADFEWRWPDGTHFSQQSVWPSRRGAHLPRAPFPFQPPPREWWDWMRARWPGTRQQARTYEEFVSAIDYDNTSRPHWDFNEQVEPETAARMRSEPASCTVDLKGELTRWDTRPEIALVSGNRWDEKGAGIRVERLIWDANKGERRMRIVLVEHRPALDGIFAPRPNWSANSILIVNRKRKEQVGWGGTVPDTIRIGTVAIGWSEDSFAPRPQWIGDHWVAKSIPEWIADASLLSYVGTPVAHIERKIVIDKFIVKPETPRNGEAR